MTFIELMCPAEDKASGEEMVKVKNLLPKTVTRPIPFCMATNLGDWDFEVIAILAWVRAQRDDKDILKATIMHKLNPSNTKAIALELAYFYTEKSREEVKDQLDPTPEQLEEKLKKIQKQDISNQVNPTK